MITEGVGQRSPGRVKDFYSICSGLKADIFRLPNLHGAVGDDLVF